MAMNRFQVESDKLDQHIDKYKRLVEEFSSQYGEENRVRFPEFKILQKPGYTIEINNCCVIIIFDRKTTTYFFAHYNSPQYRVGSNEYDVFQQMNTFIDQYSNLKAIVVGGDRNFFKQIIDFLRNKKVVLVSSYLDNYGEIEVEDSLLTKSVSFDPHVGIAKIYSPVLPNMSLLLQDQYIHLESLTGPEEGPVTDAENPVRNARMANIQYLESVDMLDLAIEKMSKEVRLAGEKANTGIFSKSRGRSHSMFTQQSHTQSNKLNPPADSEKLHRKHFG